MPLSFKIFIAIIGLMAVVVIVQGIRSYFGSHDDSVVMVVPLPIALGAMVGTYSGIAFWSESRNIRILNRIGLLGNSILILWNLTTFFYMVRFLLTH